MQCHRGVSFWERETELIINIWGKGDFRHFLSNSKIFENGKVLFQTHPSPSIAVRPLTSSLLTGRTSHFYKFYCIFWVCNWESQLRTLRGSVANLMRPKHAIRSWVKKTFEEVKPTWRLPRLISFSFKVKLVLTILHFVFISTQTSLCL